VKSQFGPRRRKTTQPWRTTCVTAASRRGVRDVLAHLCQHNSASATAPLTLCGLRTPMARCKADLVRNTPVTFRGHQLEFGCPSRAEQVVFT
jgi:hypothetical protein